MARAILIAGFAGVGKTTLAQKYKNVLDLESSFYTKDYSGIANPDTEKLKGDPSRKINPNFPTNYINAIRENQSKYDYLCIWANDTKAMPHYKEHAIEYIIVMPTKEALSEYKDIFVGRGNSEFWIEKCIASYDRQHKSFIETGMPIYYLQVAETLESWILSNPKLPALIAK